MNPARIAAIVVAAAAMLLVGGCSVAITVAVMRQPAASADGKPMPAPSPAPGPGHTVQAKQVEILDDSGKCQLVFTVRGNCPVAIVNVKGIAVEVDLCKLAKLAQDRR